MKRFVKFTAAILAAGAAATLAGCSGCTSCSGSTVNNALTNSNWFTGTSYKGIQPSIIITDGDNQEFTSEKIEYSVTLTKGANATYSVEYDEGGSYTTEFYAINYDWNTNPVYTTDKTEVLYCYKTSLSVSGKYMLTGTNESLNFSDSMTSECYFRAAGLNLQPVYAKQTISSTSPAVYQAKTLESAVSKINVEYENYYNFDCTEVKTYTTDNGYKTHEVVSLKKLKNTLFDNSSLYIAVRSMKLSDSFSQTVSVYNAADGGVGDRIISGSDTAFGDGLKEVSQELQANGLFVPSEDNATIPTVAVGINYSGGNLYGTAQTVWYAAITDPDNNTPRTTMLKLSVPLSYGLGTMEYTLKNISSTLWND